MRLGFVGGKLETSQCQEDNVLLKLSVYHQRVGSHEYRKPVRTQVTAY